MSKNLSRCGRFSLVLGVLSIVVVPLTAMNIPVAVANGEIDPQMIAINVGDTVTWQMTGGVSNFTEAFGGEWKSPMLTSTNTMFSHTFTNDGFYVYQTAGAFGTITVLPWTNSPPLVSIISPVDGFIFPWTAPVPIVAMIDPGQTNLDAVAFFVDGIQIHATSAPPYVAQFYMPQPTGAHTLTAVASFNNASYVGWSRPVTVSFGAGQNGVRLFAPRRLPSGEFVCYYGVRNGLQGIISYGDAVPVNPRAGNGGSHYGYGIYVDGTATNAPQRFYTIFGQLFP